MKQCTVQTMLCFVFFIFCMTCYMHFVLFNGNSQISTYLLRKLSFRTFDCDGVIRTYCYSNSLWYMNR